MAVQEVCGASPCEFSRRTIVHGDALLVGESVFGLIPVNPFVAGSCAECPIICLLAGSCRQGEETPEPKL
jgi:hypothetical protein